LVGVIVAKTQTSTLETLTVRVHADAPITVTNVYLPPPVDAGAQAMEPFFAATSDDAQIILGDFNSHHSSWSHTTSPAGETIRALIDDHNWLDGPSFYDTTDPQIEEDLPPIITRPTASSRPDLILTHNLDFRSIKTISAHVSDHVPLVATLASDDIQLIRHTAHRHNYRFWPHDAPQWAEYKARLEHEMCVRSKQILQLLRTTCPMTRQSCFTRANDLFVEAVHAASKHIPRGGAHKTPSHPPYWNKFCELATTMCDTVSAEPALKSHIPAFRRSRTHILTESKRQHYEDVLTNLSPTDSSAWRFFQSRSERTCTVVGGKTSVHAQSNLFIKHWTPPFKDKRARPPKSRPLHQKLSLHELRHAISRLSLRKAAGPDNINSEHLKHMTPDGIAERMLFSLISESLNWGVLPQSWKHAWIVPLLKPRKNATEVSSYRPVSLTSVISKVAERVIDSRLRFHLRFHPHQHAYQHAHCADDAVMTLVDSTYRQWSTNHWQDYYIQGVLKRNHQPRSNRAGLAFFDMSDAFSRMPHSHLVSRLRALHIAPHLIRWVCGFLSGRTAQCLLDGILSRVRSVTRGAPQGTILGPLLWLIFIDDLAHSLNSLSASTSVLFADDITTLGRGTTAAEVSRALQEATHIIEEWALARNMIINAQKCTAILLSTSTHTKEDQQNPGLTLGDTNIPLTIAPNPDARELGVLLDARLNFSANTSLRCKVASQQLRKLAFAARVGPSHHALRSFARALMESRLFYCSGSWGHDITPAQLVALNKVQRKMSRSITGVLPVAPGDSALLEANILPAQVIVPTNCASLVERWRRLPPTDPRMTAVTTPLPTKSTRRATMPFRPHPWTSTLALISNVLNARHVPAAHPREPILVHRSADPALIRKPIRRITFLEFSVHEKSMRASLSLFPKDKPAGKALRFHMNVATLAAATAIAPSGPFTYELWSDASVIDAETPACVSGGVGILFRGETEIQRQVVACGKLACSYWAEAHTIRTCLQTFKPILRVEPPGKLLIAMDSQSFLRALASGPLACTTQVEDDTWTDLLDLASLGWHIVLVFVFSHVGTPRNELVDKLCEESIPLIPLAQMNAAPIWHTDVVRAIRRTKIENWKEGPECDVPRNAIAGTSGTPLRDLTVPRQMCIHLCRIRTGPNTLFGPYRSVINGTYTNHCRFCTAPGATAFAIHAAPTPADVPPARIQCPHCPITLKSQHGLLQHCRRAHPDDAIVAAPGAAITCECGRVFDSANSRRVHRITCEAWQAVYGRKRPDAPPVPPAPVRAVAIESVSHFRDCPSIPIRAPAVDAPWQAWIPFIQQFIA
jgi:hypothetical protein